MLPLLEAASLHLSEVTTALPLLEAAGLHLYLLAQLMLFAFFVSKGSLFLCELHSTESTLASHNTQLWCRAVSHRYFCTAQPQRRNWSQNK